MIINHYIVRLIVYYISCWRPTEAQLKEFVALCRNFLWGGDPWIKKVVKVKWEHCTIPQHKGGLGITNIQELDDRMAAKWIVRGLQNSQENWAILLFKNMKKFTLKGKPKWDNPPDMTI